MYLTLCSTEEEYNRMRKDLYDSRFVSMTYYKGYVSFDIFFNYQKEFEAFLDKLVTYISIPEISEVIYEEGIDGIYYILPGKWEFQEMIKASQSISFKRHVQTYKHVLKTKENLNNVIEDLTFDI